VQRNTNIGDIAKFSRTFILSGSLEEFMKEIATR
jgi:hypothetical protein